MMKLFTTYILLLIVYGATLPGCSTNSRDYRVIHSKRQADSARAARLNTAALVAIDSQSWEAAETLLADALKADVGYGPAHNNLGKVYYEQGKFYLAAWEFEYAIKLMPYHPEPRNNLGLVLEGVRRFDDAVAEYEEAVDRQPDNPELLGNLARAKLRRGDPPAEIKQLLMDIVLKDTRPEWRKWAEERLVQAHD